jgi:hypothetical protein
MKQQAMTRRTVHQVPNSIEKLRESALVSQVEVERIAGEIQARIEPAFLNNLDKPLEGYALVRHVDGACKLHNLSFGGAEDYLRQTLISERLSDEDYRIVSNAYQAQQQSKRENELFRKAEKIPMSQWKEALFLGDTYHSSVDELIDWVASTFEPGDSLPGYAYAAERVEPMKFLSAQHLTDRVYDHLADVEGMEDWEFKDMDQLQEAVEEFAKANSDCVFFTAGTSRAILLDWSEVKLEQ